MFPSTGAKQFVHTPHEIYQLLAKNLQSMSYALVKRNAPMTILHVSALEGRTDVMQVRTGTGPPDNLFYQIPNLV